VSAPRTETENPMTTTRIRARRSLLVLLASAALAAGALPAAATQPTVDDARRFLADAEARLLDLAIQLTRAQWVLSTYITEDTEALAARANEAMIAAAVELANASKRYDGLALPDELARKMLLLKIAIPLPAPSDPAKTAELAQIAARMEGVYGKGKYCPPDGSDCLAIGEISNLLATSREPAKLLEVWEGWHAIAAEGMRDDYRRFVELANEGARELGFADLGAMWRSNYDMPPDAFAAELDRLWEQMRPLYEQLHCYVRSRLVATYGPEVVPPDGPIPAHLLGNLWQQQWSNVYDLVAPADVVAPGYDLTERLQAAGYDAIRMVKTGEAFFTSLGFEPLPETFWTRSMFVKPRDREVVCHASAWAVDQADDLRIKMCIEVNETDFDTIHHELGHNFYQRLHNLNDPLFRSSANDGFHEALGDTVALSITPEYLKRIGLIDEVPPAEADIPLLLRTALDKIAFVPFGLIIDKWRWEVFSGATSPAEYNRAWWDLKRKYQGVAPATPRGEAHFDPGAKYHVPANVPYMRYFLAHVLQFQFHRSLAETAGAEGPLHRASIYGSREAGAKLDAMMRMGLRFPWQDALAALTGEREMDATAVLAYFAPLQSWLEGQNSGRTCGW
jgi:peptidyl-dipeptidase A